MSMQNLIDAIRIVEKYPDKGSFAGQRSEELIITAEARLGLAFPPTYRKFLLALGAGNFGSVEFYGVIDENFETSSVPDGIWFTLTERKEIDLPHRLIAIGVTSYGELYCLDTAKKPEGPIIVYQSHLGPDEQQPEVVADDFGEFFLAQITARL